MSVSLSLSRHHIASETNLNYTHLLWALMPMLLAQLVAQCCLPRWCFVTGLLPLPLQSVWELLDNLDANQSWHKPAGQQQDQ